MNQFGRAGHGLNHCPPPYRIDIPRSEQNQRRYGGQPVFIDVPTENQAALALAGSMGLTVQRRLVRMCRGEPVKDRVEELWASSGPEKG